MVRIAKRSEQPQPPEPTGYGDVVDILYGMRHAVLSINSGVMGEDAKELSLACSRELRIDKHMKPHHRFRLARANLKETVSCVTCRESLNLDMDNAAPVR